MFETNTYKVRLGHSVQAEGRSVRNGNDKSQRQRRIHDLLAGSGRLGVKALARQMDVALMTIRRDLADMERAGLLTRTHGGCVLQTPFVTELSFAEKSATHAPEKRAIAREVVRRLRPNQNVYLDTGTTALQVARALPPGLKLRLFTNNLRVALEVSGRKEVEVVVYGGRLAERSPDLVGESAIHAIGLFRVDVAVLGCDAVDLDRGELYAADLGTAALSRQVQRAASRVLFVADHSKLGRRGHAVVGRLGKGITLVTDDGTSPALRRRLRGTQATVIVAGVNEQRA